MSAEVGNPINKIRVKKTIPVTYIETDWELDGELWVCNHPELRYEIIEVDYMKDGEHDTYEKTICICTDCEEELAKE